MHNQSSAVTIEAQPNRTVLIRQVDVLRRTALSRGTLYELINAGRFPKPLKLGLRLNGWPEQEIEEWIQGRIAERCS